MKIFSENKIFYKINKLRNTSKRIIKPNVSTNKFDRLKEKNIEKENSFIKISLEKNLLESKCEKIIKQSTEEINYLNSIIEKEKQLKENLVCDMQILFRKNEEFKLSYEELSQQNSELVERNKKLEKLSKIDKKTLQDYGTLQ